MYVIWNFVVLQLSFILDEVLIYFLSTVDSRYLRLSRFLQVIIWSLF